MHRADLTLLVVEDDEEMAELYRSWAFPDWSVTIATTAEAARAAIDDDPDIAVLDRRLPDGCGDDVLADLRAAGNDCPTVMVTAAEPDFDIIELPFDDYLVKPFEHGTYRDTLGQLADRLTYDAELREFYSLAAKKAVLDARKPDAELAASTEYGDLEARVVRQRARADAMLPHDPAGYAGLFRNLFADAATN
jgi:two-component system response regulator AdeR